MKRFIKNSDRNIYLIFGNLRSHYSKPVKHGLEAYQGLSFSFQFYISSELNPDEYLMERWARSGTHGRLLYQLKKNPVFH
jgi:hypothetical protein